MLSLPGEPHRERVEGIDLPGSGNRLMRGSVRPMVASAGAGFRDSDRAGRALHVGEVAQEEPGRKRADEIARSRHH